MTRRQDENVERVRERQRAPKITLSIMLFVVIIIKNDNAPNYMMTKIWEFNLLLRGLQTILMASFSRRDGDVIRDDKILN